MDYDDGEVLPGLNETWTFVGATVMEWASGLVVFLMISAFSSSPARAMPAMLLGWLLTTLTLAALRNSFPDEERGVRNAMMTSCGFKPLTLPAPSSLQPVWSAAPLREVPLGSRFAALGLDSVFPTFEEQLTEADPEEG